jgi:ribosomal protein S18 acetylase RimI-like enzyme
MAVEIVSAEEQFIESHRECLDEVARERRFLHYLEAPPQSEVRAFIKELIANGQTQFFAVDGEKSVGWCSILRKRAPTLAHVGALGIGIRKAYRGMGIGKRLMQTAIEDATKKGVERIELSVFENNQSAISLYLKLGFKVEGKVEKFVKIDGVYYPALYMARLS